MKSKRIFSLILSGVVVISTGLFTSIAKADTTTVVTPSIYGIVYKGHVQNIGWQNPVTVTGDQTDITKIAEAGTNGKGLRVEAIKISGTNLPEGASITYQGHVQNIGWQTPVTVTGNKDINTVEEAGTDGKGLRVEAFKMTLNGMPGYAIKYRTHVENIGWQNAVETVNGTTIANASEAGTDGKGLRMEAIQIEIVKTSDTTLDSSDHAVLPVNTQYISTPLINGVLSPEVNDITGKTKTPSGTFNAINNGRTSIGNVYNAINSDASLFSTGEMTKQAVINDNNSGSEINNGGVYTSNGITYKLAGIYTEKTTLNSNDANKLATAATTLNTQFMQNIDKAQTYDRIFINYIGNTNEIVRVVEYFVRID